MGHPYFSLREVDVVIQVQPYRLQLFLAVSLAHPDASHILEWEGYVWMVQRPPHGGGKGGVVD